MIEIDCMKLGDCFTPKELVSEIFNQCSTLKPPIPVEDIARAVGIANIIPIKTNDLEGLLVADEEKSTGSIFYKERSPLGRQRFTIGHELGHFLIPKHSSKQQCTNKDMNTFSNRNDHEMLEKEANEFAQLLLMPDKLISKALVNQQPDFNFIKSIADKFKMSFEPIANRCSYNSKIPFALIYSQNDLVRYCWKNKYIFKYELKLTKNSPLPSTSQAKNHQNTKETISKFTTTPPQIWLTPNPKLAFPKKLVEQTIIQDRGFKITMLRIDQK